MVASPVSVRGRRSTSSSPSGPTHFLSLDESLPPLVNRKDLVKHKDGGLIHPGINLSRPHTDFPLISGLPKVTPSMKVTQSMFDQPFIDLGVSEKNFCKRVPSKEEGSSDSAGDDEMVIYWANFEHRLTLLADPFVEHVLTFIETDFSQLIPEDLKKIICFATLSRLMGKEPTLGAFLLFWRFYKKTSGKIGLKYHQNKVKLFAEDPHAISLTDGARVFVSSRMGWRIPRRHTEPSHVGWYQNKAWQLTLQTPKDQKFHDLLMG